MIERYDAYYNKPATSCVGKQAGKRERNYKTSKKQSKVIPIQAWTGH
jgi:hypothetical protein